MTWGRAVFFFALLRAGAACAPADVAPAPASAPRIEPSAPAAALGGRVEGPEHEPVAGALVAAIPIGMASNDPPWPRAVVTSESGGAFAFRDLAPGRYGVTASAPNLAAGYAGIVDVAPGAAPRATVTLGGKGFTVTGRVLDKHGSPAAGSRVAAARYSEVEGDIFVAKVEPDGTFVLRLPWSDHELFADAPGRAPFSAHLDPGVHELTAELEDPTPPAPSDAEMSAWVRGSGFPIATSEAEKGTADLAPLRRIVGSSRVVALGESSHGTSEFFGLKHRIFEYLATELGFGAFAMEANLPEAAAIDAYVVHGTGDPREAIVGLELWAWETEEFLDLVKWMRRFNQDPAHRRKLRFYGIDAQFAPRAVLDAVAYLKRVDGDAATAFERASGPLAPSMAAAAYRVLPEEKKVEIRAAITATLARFDSERPRWVKKTGEPAFTWARKQVDVVRQTEAYYLSEPARDVSMAENLRFHLERDPGTRFVVWAHDAHVSFEPRQNAMGKRLRDALGADYLAIGLAFEKGTVRAYHPDAQGGAVGTFDVGPAPAGSFDERLAAAGSPRFAIDLRGAPPTIARWLDAPLVVRELGGVFLDQPRTLRRLAPARRFDALVFVREGHASHGLATIKR